MKANVGHVTSLRSAEGGGRLSKERRKLVLRITHSDVQFLRNEIYYIYPSRQPPPPVSEPNCSELPTKVLLFRNVLDTESLSFPVRDRNT